MPFTINIPRPPKLPRALLLDQIATLPMGDNVEARWAIDGVTWEPVECGVPLLWAGAADACDPSPFEGTPPRGCLPPITQTGFRIEDRFRASLPDFDASDVEALLTRRFSVMTSWVFAKALTQSVAGPTSLPDVATAPTGLPFGSTATPIWNAFAVLEAELSERLMGEQGVIFLTPGLLAQAKVSYDLEWFDGPADDGEPGGRAIGWQTPAGNRVIVDGGFYNADAPTGEDPSGTAEEWIYASGPVFYQSTMPDLRSSREAPGVDRNRITGFIDSHGILVFEPCPVMGVLASYDVN
jgi:hypothetical protein